MDLQSPPFNLTFYELNHHHHHSIWNPYYGLYIHFGMSVIVSIQINLAHGNWFDFIDCEI